jgi:hypothetical protein
MVRGLCHIDLDAQHDVARFRRQGVWEGLRLYFAATEAVFQLKYSCDVGMNRTHCN